MQLCPKCGMRLWSSGMCGCPSRASSMPVPVPRAPAPPRPRPVPTKPGPKKFTLDELLNAFEFFCTEIGAKTHELEILHSFADETRRRIKKLVQESRGRESKGPEDDHHLGNIDGCGAPQGDGGGPPVHEG